MVGYLCLLAPVVIVVGRVGSQTSAEHWLTAVARLVKTANSHRIGLKELFDDVVISVVEAAVQISLSEGVKIAHAINEKLRIVDAVFLPQCFEKRFGGISPSML